MSSSYANDLSSHCIGCPYENAQHLPVTVRATRAAPLTMEDNDGTILLIFQAPGINEWSNGRPVSSTTTNSAGMKLAAAFAFCKKTRASYNITNAVQCFPGKKESTVGKRPRDKAPLIAARRHCGHWLRKDITAHNYERIVVFGSPAREAVIALGYINDTRFVFVKHPNGGLSDVKLRNAVG